MAPAGVAERTGYRPTGPGGWTTTDLEALPDDGQRYEIVDGVLLVSPSPAIPHQRVSMRLAQVLIGACPPGFEVFAAPLDWQPAANRSFEPDLLVVNRSDATGAKLTGVPALVVEIASPSTARIDRTLKFSAYADSGVPQYWIVDPGGNGNAPTIEVYDLVDGAYQLQAHASGDDPATVTGAISVAVTPASLTR
jgi:Uma2 family endonuclease